MTGCIKRDVKKKHEVPKQLVDLVEQVNSSNDKELGNGLTLTGCRIEEGDSIFTYLITTHDKRFDTLSPDSVKSLFAADFGSESKRKIARVLSRHDMALQYICTLPDSTTMEVIFTPAELKKMGQ